MSLRLIAVLFVVVASAPSGEAQQFSQKQLQQWMQRFPQADLNGDGKLSAEEARKGLAKLQQRQRQQNKTKGPKPTHENVVYGPWKRNVLDLWLPESKAHAAPLIVYIHGGGFEGGNKESVRGSANISMSLDHGVAFAAIHYRFRHPRSGSTRDPERAGIQDIMRDAARAIQFIRLHAAEYRIDPTRIACYGGSAGAGTSVWLAAHDDIADPENADPVLRQSSRISAAGALNGQFTYDLTKWDAAFADQGGDIAKTHGRDGRIEAHNFYGLTADEYAGVVGKKCRADVDMCSLLSRDDPPIFAMTNTGNQRIHNAGIYNHHPRHARLIEDRCREVGVDVLCLMPKVRPEDAKKLSTEPGVMMTFFFEKLGVDTHQR